LDISSVLDLLLPDWTTSSSEKPGTPNRKSYNPQKQQLMTLYVLQMTASLTKSRLPVSYQKYKNQS